MSVSRDVRVQAGAAAPAPWRVKLFRWGARAIFRAVFRVRVRGRRYLPAGPAIYCANHLGWTDAFLVLLFFPVEPRIYVLGEREGVLQTGFRTRLIDSLQIMIPLDRAQPREAIRIMEDVLARGGSLLIFPEGQVGSVEGALAPLQAGAAHLSLRSGLPIVPVGLTGTNQLWLRRTITVRIGPPLSPAAFATGRLHARVDALTAALDAAMRALLPGAPALPRFRPLQRWLTNLF